MANEYNPFEPRTMGRLIERMPPVHTFFKSTLFKNVKTFVTKSVDVDFKKGNRALAPFVHPKLGGETIANSGFQIKSYTPPLVAPDKVTSVTDLETRMAGENIYSGTSPAERAIKKIAADFAELDEMITRREEWMAAQSIFTGEIPIIGKSLNEKIDFSFTNKETLTTTARWSAAASDPVADLKRWRKQVQKTGFVNCNICVMSDDVAAAFIKHEKVMSLLDVKNYDIAAIKPREMPNGVTYVGSINGIGLDIYTYNEWYLDNWTDPANPVQNPLVPEKTLALLSTSAQYSMYYGGITLLDGRGGAAEEFITVEGARVPDSWTARKPARRFVQLNSMPLPVPHEVDSWFVAVVL